MPSTLVFGTVFGVLVATASLAQSTEFTDDEPRDLVERSYQHVAMYNVSHKFAVTRGDWNAFFGGTEVKGCPLTDIALQDAIIIELDHVGTFEVLYWDLAPPNRTRIGLFALAAEARKTADGAFEARDEGDPIMHFFTRAVGWGGNPREAAVYTSFFPASGKGLTPFAVTVPGQVSVERAERIRKIST
ncbi:MAG: hypothetical protein QNJ03_06915 [Dinoroseobacter sp.]|nr:hypothetical protein [Dinoroseobacter sp.]